jgi:hypothetical protein
MDCFTFFDIELLSQLFDLNLFFFTMNSHQEFVVVDCMDYFIFHYQDLSIKT